MGPSFASIDSEDVLIRGVSLVVSSPDPTDQLIRPRNGPVILGARVEDGSGGDLSSDPTFAGTIVRGRLSGNGIDEPISSPLGSALEIGTSNDSEELEVGRPLLEPGNYTISELRLEDSSGTTLLEANPSTLTIRVIDRVIVQNLSTRPLSLEEIRDRGIVIGDDNYMAFSFTFGLGTDSEQVNIEFDVLFPPDDEPG